MALALTHAHAARQRRLREIVAQAVLTVWRGLAHYDDVDVDPFLSRALPIVYAGQKRAAEETIGYLARVLRIPYFGIDPALVTGAAVRSDVDPAVVYRRPFIQVWQDLGDGKPFDDAVQAASSRLDAVAQTDIALASRAAYQVAQDEVEGIYGYERVASATACEFCRKVAGAYVKSAMASPLHDRCSCTLQPLTRPHPKAKWLPDGTHVTEDYAVHVHGEMGAVLTNPDDHFSRKPSEGGTQ